MSMLKQVDVKGDTNAATPDAKAAFHEAVSRVEDAFTVALKAAEDKLAATETTLATLRKEHEAMQKAYAEAQGKLAILSELKAKLATL